MVNQEHSYYNLGISSDQDETMRNYFSRFPEELIASVMDAFVINKPKTGKSGGDGFWVHQKGDELYLVLYDCMGHGHLASMMTRIYAQSVEKVILEDKVEDPGTILRYLHYRILTQFKGKTKVKIGPSSDVGVLKINTAMRKIEYSGARLELIHVLGNGKTEVIKSGRMPIGDYPDQEHDYGTTLVELSSQRISNFYINSDGFKDQAGGESGKKLGRKGLVEMLEKLHGKPMLDQKNQITEFISNWKGGHGQVDDMLMIGFAI